jgi:hypothetical protein
MTIQDFDPDFAGPADWAAMYRLLGIQVVPAHLPEAGKQWKRPLIEWKVYTTFLIDDELFAKWYGTTGLYSNHENMGMISGVGRYVVIDLDLQKQLGASEWWNGKLMAFNNGLPLDTPTQITGGGGNQLIVRWPEGYPMPTMKTPIGIDIRGQGGFAVLPMSMHESGRRYEFVEGYEPWTTPIMEAPLWLVEAVLALQAQYGSGSGSTGQAPAQRTETPAEAISALGHLQDGREEHMTKLVWAAVVDCYRESPIPMAPAESDEVMRAAYQRYEDGVTPRLVGTKTKAELLEDEHRGLTYFSEKWSYALK